MPNIDKFVEACNTEDGININSLDKANCEVCGCEYDREDLRVQDGQLMCSDCWDRY